jgi:signal transduction histidine kinase
VAALLALPRPVESRSITPRHLGNLVLIVCSLSVALIVVILEPAMHPERKATSNAIIIFHCIGLASMFVTALYLLWSHRWQLLYWPLVLLLVGAGLHMGTYVTYIHDLMIGEYIAANWVNVSWLFVFGAYAAAAHERTWQMHRDAATRADSLRRRERILEALVPALLIVLMLGVAWLYREWLSTRSASLAMAPAIGFAVVLGLREAWIQRQEQRLMVALHDANASMQSANNELQQSEGRYRKLNADLESRVAERTMELEQAYRELENFSYAVAHDLKAPLRAVDGFGSMLAHEYADRLDNTGQHYVQRMRTSAIRMSELIDDLLAYARVDRREFNVRAVGLSMLVETVLQEQRDEIAKQRINLQVDVPNLTVLADQSGLHMSLRNLVQNAIKFSQQSSPPRIAIRAEPQGAYVIIRIQDNGIGFDMNYHDRIFEMFQRLHRADEIPGTGIGLAIVRKAMDRMGGKVWAESTPGEGATFFVRIANAIPN